MQLAATWLLTGKYQVDAPAMKSGMWSVVRKTMPALRATAVRDFDEILSNEDRLRNVTVNKTFGTYKFSGRTVEFFSLADEMRIRSRKRDIMHIVESNEINHNEFLQLMLRTKIKIFLDLNPSDVNSWCKTEIEDKRLKIRKDVDVIVSTFEDNPFLTETEKENIRYLKDVDPALWEIFGRGNWGTIAGLVYDFEIVDQIPDGIEKWGVGLDFGYSIDETAIVKVAAQNDKLYLKELMYKTHMTNQDIAFWCKENVKGGLIVADSAEPKSIEEIQRENVRIIPARKGQGSLLSGIKAMKKYKIHVTADSVNLIKELRAYKWHDEKADMVVGLKDHLLDAARYYVQTKLRSKGAMVLNYT